MSENRTVYQLRCTGSQDMWNRKHSFYSQTVYLDRQAAEADAAAFRAKCTRSEGVSSMLDLAPDAVVTIVELALVTPSPPRRTLADVVANPPEGWTSSTSFASGHEDTHFDRRAPGGEVATVCISPGWASVEVSFGTSNLKRARALSREVDDLLDLLAEVSDE